jgi:hypothetical protein
VLVRLGDELEQVGEGWLTRETNWLDGPVWTPDSALLVVAENPVGAGPWWAEHVAGEAEDDDRSPGGAFSPGSLVVLDRELRGGRVAGSRWGCPEVVSGRGRRPRARAARAQGRPRGCRARAGRGRAPHRARIAEAAGPRARTRAYDE